MKLRTCILLMASCAVLVGCARSVPAPVSERPPAAKQAAPAAAAAKAAPVVSAKPEPMPSGAVVAPFKAASETVQAKPLTGAPAARAAIAPPVVTSGILITEPKGVRLPYSDQALAQLGRPAAPAGVTRAEPPRAESRPDTGGDATRGPDDLDWSWPVRGKIVGTFNDTTSKGIAIAGKLGQPVLASAPGRVIFSGTGIRGFGKLIVIKHNDTYLSVYAHNSELTVKEGQNVTKGQKIAEMGNSDADQVKLHFEIRRFGKPIDPIKLLPSPA